MINQLFMLLLLLLLLLFELVLVLTQARVAHKSHCGWFGNCEVRV